LKDLGFFCQHELLPDSAKQAEIFRQEVQTQYEMCQKEKLYRENSKLGQFVVDSYRGMIERHYQKNYTALVKILIGIKQKIDEIDGNTAQEIID
jgi:hypothetical protein